MRALRRATQLHAGQTRKDGKTPYIFHPVQAALFLSHDGAPDAEVSAALLHDVVEDTPITAAELKREFGSDISEMVLACSEDKSIRDWDVRKEELFARLRTASDGAKRVKAADVLANMTDLIASLKKDKKFWNRFSTTRAQKTEYYADIIKIVRPALSPRLRKQLLAAHRALVIS